MKWSMYLEDDMQAWVLTSEGTYKRAIGDGQLSAQMSLLTLYDDRVALAES